MRWLSVRAGHLSLVSPTASGKLGKKSEFCFDNQEPEFTLLMKYFSIHHFILLSVGNTSQCSGGIKSVR
jgi:hypothetical protein